MLRDGAGTGTHAWRPWIIRGLRSTSGTPGRTVPSPGGVFFRGYPEVRHRQPQPYGEPMHCTSDHLCSGTPDRTDERGRLIGALRRGGWNAIRSADRAALRLSPDAYRAKSRRRVRDLPSGSVFPAEESASLWHRGAICHWCRDHQIATQQCQLRCLIHPEYSTGALFNGGRNVCDFPRCVARPSGSARTPERSPPTTPCPGGRRKPHRARTSGARSARRNRARR